MEYMLTPYSHAFEPFCWWENAFSVQELDLLQNKAMNASERALIGGISSQDIASIEHLNRVRRSNISWVNCNAETEWIFSRLAHVVSSLNSQFYKFNLTGFGEPLQFTNYDGSEQGMYGWHQDYGSQSISRKLSVVVQLTDPSQYEGGNLQIKTSGQEINVMKQRGLIAVFPSYQLHQVTPVTQGSRQSLVAWISGPAFK